VDGDKAVIMASFNERGTIPTPDANRNGRKSPWLIRSSGSVQNAGEFKIWFLKFDAYHAPQEQKHGGAGTMTIFEGLLLVLTIAGMTAAYEWRHDVLYGPYLRSDDQLGVR
jgi:hypothetical protein